MPTDGRQVREEPLATLLFEEAFTRLPVDSIVVADEVRHYLGHVEPAIFGDEVGAICPGGDSQPGIGLALAHEEDV